QAEGARAAATGLTRPSDPATDAIEGGIVRVVLRIVGNEGFVEHPRTTNVADDPQLAGVDLTARAAALDGAKLLDAAAVPTVHVRVHDPNLVGVDELQPLPLANRLAEERIHPGPV